MDCPAKVAVAVASAALAGFAAGGVVGFAAAGIANSSTAGIPAASAPPSPAVASARPAPGQPRAAATDSASARASAEPRRVRTTRGTPTATDDSQRRGGDAERGGDRGRH